MGTGPRLQGSHYYILCAFLLKKTAPSSAPSDSGQQPFMPHKGLSSAPLLRSLHPGGGNAPGKASRHGAWCGCTTGVLPRSMMRPLVLEKTEPWTVSGAIMFAGDSLLPSLPEGTRVPLGASCCLCVKSWWEGLSRRWSRQAFPYYPKVTRCRPMAKTQT